MNLMNRGLRNTASNTANNNNSLDLMDYSLCLNDGLSPSQGYLPNTASNNFYEDEYRYINNESETELDRVKTKLTSLWNNVKYGWGTYLRKNKTSFDKNSSLWVLGKKYNLNSDCDFNQFQSISSPRSSMTKDGFCYIHDQSESRNDIQGFEHDIYNKLWFTYRKDFPAINGTKYTSDCGWGCMLRSAQMMIAQGFILHFLDRDWDMFKSVSPSDHTMHREIISWFNDRPSLKCPFGLHRLLDVAEKLGKKVGDWFGPVSVTQIMRDALDRGKEFIGFLDGIKFYVAQDCCVYKQDVLDLCLKADENDSLINEGAGVSNMVFTPVIILISVRLGGEELNEIYVPTLKMFLEMKNCLGIIGGKPKHSLYFIGYQDDKVIYLDPHVCQDSVDISSQDFDKSSFHCYTPSKIAFNKLDPSLAIGFYCRTLEDFERLYSLVHNMTSNDSRYKDNAIQPIFSVCDDRYERAHSYLNSLNLNESILSPSALYGVQTPQQPQQTVKSNNNPYESSSKTTPSKHYHLKQSSAKPRAKKSSKNRTVSQELDDFVLIN